MGLTEELDARRGEIIDLMVHANGPADEGAGGEFRQFIVGYFNILRAATAEDFGPRDEYLSTVIPALRQSGMPLSVIMVGLVRLVTVVAAALGVEHTKWLCEFQGDYTARILAMWEEAA
jgi:hypothetical protein